MNKINNERGNVSLIVAAILLFMTTVGLSVLSMTSVDLQTAFNLSWKAKSDALVEFGLEEYRDRMNEVLLQKDAYHVKNVDLTLLNKTSFTVDEGAGKEADIEFFDVELDTNPVETRFEYLNSLTTSGNTDGVVLYKKPFVDDTFQKKAYEDIVGVGSGVVSIDSIFNEAYNGNEFFITKATFNELDGLLKEIQLFNYYPEVEDTTDAPLVVSTKSELETSMGGAYNLDGVNLNDNIEIDVAWDKNINSPIIMLSLSVSEDNRIHIFTLTPLIDTNFQYYDTLTLTDKVLRSEIKVTYDDEKRTVVSTLNVLKETTTSGNVLSIYPIYYPLDTTIDLTRKVDMFPPENSRTISTSLVWNDALDSSQLFLFSVEDVLSGSDLQYNAQISIYKLNLGIDSTFSKEDVIDLAPFGISKVHSLGSDVFWSDLLKEGIVSLIFSSPNEIDATGEYKLFNLETNIFNFDKTEVTEISTVPNDISNVGRIKVAGTTKDEFGEMLVFVEKAYAKVEKVVLKNKDEYNFIISSYEDNNSGRIGSKTKVVIEPEIEVVTIMDSSVRFIKSFTVKEMYLD